MAKKNYYLNNRKLLECIVAYTAKCRAYAKAGKPKPPMPEYAGECILLICNRMGTRFNFVGYSYRDELIGDAILDCVHAFYNFDSDRFSNPFGYFSRVGWRAMIRKIFTEKKETYLKHKSFRMSTINGSQYEVPDGYTDPNAIRAGAATEISDSGQGMSDGVVDDFESLLDRRRKTREKGIEDRALAKEEAAAEAEATALLAAAE